MFSTVALCIYVFTEQIHSAFTSVGSQVLKNGKKKTCDINFVKIFAFNQPCEIFLCNDSSNLVETSIPYTTSVTSISSAVPPLTT